ncbi:cysteine hydrolase family protein [Hoeflea prorocentri]|uniref:Cysteine hydrolase n=1 Tax=Hoeflea prorocentri TaxID=1922333 RepID=A0A9X3UF33_9HYPH|nr:isochorismatase family cysteine hydrolase [Hoeflea prorocentri]MCY6380193.1 cysteine hydrolase [Hoeflea prorocentri]MDA5397993.1 cysteine hydrolase [Hoeflea prorocentri]
MKTALIVIDMQNSFLHPDGENYYDGAQDVVDNCLTLIAKARSTGTLIVHVADRHRRNFDDFESKHLPRHCVSGGFHAEFFEGFGPLSDGQEIEIEKRRFSAFFATELALFLTEQSVERLILCGVKTNVCVRATAQDAFAHGFEVCVVKDATNSNRQHLADASLEDIERYLGRLVTTQEAAELLA